MMDQFKVTLEKDTRLSVVPTEFTISINIFHRVRDRKGIIVRS